MYDQDTGLYYLQSRYYNPEWGRFINADVYVSTGQGLLGNNMFAYCLNNPVNAFDPTGEDAIWLGETYNSASKIFGHTGLLIQDKAGVWYYFNCNNIGCTLKEVGNIDYNDIKDLPGFISNKYDVSIYFKGDFSTSIEYAKKLGKTFSRKDYKLLRNNCMQVSIDVLIRGKFAQSDASYKSFLRRVSNCTIPNIAFSRVYNFHNAVQTYHAAPRWARWLYTSPEMAVWMY